MNQLRTLFRSAYSSQSSRPNFSTSTSNKTWRIFSPPLTQFLVLAISASFFIQPISTAYASNSVPIDVNTNSSTSTEQQTDDVNLEIPSGTTQVDNTPSVNDPAGTTSTDQPTDITSDSTDDTDKSDTKAPPTGDALTHRVLPGNYLDTSVTSKVQGQARPQVSNSSGSLTYSYAFKVPNGRSGLQPDLSLSYNSSSGSDGSVFGYGWNLNLPSIERVNRNGVDRLYTDNIFQSSLDGELVNTSGSEYRSKFDSGNNLKYTYTANSWSITDRKGLTYKFGTAASSRQDDPTNTSRIYRWYLDEVRDQSGNYIRYGYFKDSGQVYPLEIVYTGNGNTDGIFRVDFRRETRPGNLSGSASSYATGFPVKTQFVISRVDVSAGGLVPGNRIYQLAYTSSSNQNRVLLSSITEQGTKYNSIGNSSLVLPPVNFDYTTSTRSWSNTASSWSIPSDVGQIVKTNAVSPNPWENSTASLVDLNGDSLPDLFSYPPDSGLAKVYLNNGSSFVENTTWTIPTRQYCPGVNTSLTPYSTPGLQINDFNGDGYPDLLVLNAKVKCNVNGQYYPVFSAFYKGSNSGWTLDNTFTLPTDISIYDQYNPSRENGVRFADINGDRLPDLVQSNGIGNGSTTVDIRLNNGSGFDLANNSSFTIPVIRGCAINSINYEDNPVWIKSPNNLQNGAILADFNGDGLADFLVTEIQCSNANGYAGGQSAQHGVYLNTGTTWVWSSGLPNDISSSFYNQLTDLNNDGLLDLVDSQYGAAVNGNYTATSTSYLGLPNGWMDEGQNAPINPPRSFNWPTETSCENTSLPVTFRNNWNGGLFTQTEPYHPGSSGLTVADVNGDGLSDLVKVNAEVPCSTFPTGGAQNIPPMVHTYRSAVWAASGDKPDLLKKITYPAGGSTTITYRNTGAEKLSGSLEHPNLPASVTTVASITDDDAYGLTAATTYAYSGGKFFRKSPRESIFAGFNKVSSTAPDGGITTSYYHQADGISGTESIDNETLIGRPYRVTLTNGSGVTLSDSFTRYNVTALPNGRSLVTTSNQAKAQYDGSSHVDTAIAYTYTADGNVATKADLGSVNITDTFGNFVDTGSDAQTIAYTYATFGPGSLSGIISDLPAVITTTNATGVQIANNRITYDNLAIGTLSRGLVTKNENWNGGKTYYSTQSSYNSFGLPITQTDTRGKVTTIAYNSDNLYPSSVTNPLSQTTAYQYDYFAGSAYQTNQPNGEVWLTYWNGLDLPDQVMFKASSGAGASQEMYWVYDFSSRGHFSTTSNDYLASNYSQVMNVETRLDGLLRPIQKWTQTPNYNAYRVTDTFYDNMGRVSQTSLPYFAAATSATNRNSAQNTRTTTNYDLLGRVVSVTNSIGVTANSYSGYTTTTTNPRGNTKSVLKNARGWITSVIENNNGNSYTTNYNYNDLGRLTQLTDAAGNIRRFTYNVLGYRTSAEDLHASGDTEFGVYGYGYDQAGNLTSETRPDGTSITSTYDDLGRLTSRDANSAPGIEELFVYDTCVKGIGRMCSSERVGVAKLALEYSARGDVIKQTSTISGQNFVTNNTYDLAGNIIETTAPDGSKTRYLYESAGGLISSVTHKETTDPDFTPVISSITYNPAGQPLVITSANGVITTNTYDNTKQNHLTNRTVTGVLANGQPGTLSNITFTYDNNGNVTALSESAGLATRSTTYTYDSLDRLLTATTTGVTAPAVGLNTSESFTYDALGNITSKNGVAYTYGGNAAGNYANPHAVTAIGGSTLSYDRNGQLTDYTESGRSRSYAWDYAGRMTSVSVNTGDNSASASYGYLPSGDRAVKHVVVDNNLVRTFSPSPTYRVSSNSVALGKPQVWPANNLVTPNLSTANKDIMLGAMMIASVSGSGSGNSVSYVQAGITGSPELFTDSAGKTATTQVFSSYGEQGFVSSTPSSQRAFTGYLLDPETALSYANARYYDQSYGRFTSEDPVYLAIGDANLLKSKFGLDQDTLLVDPQSYNSYAYARNNPIVNTDPSGNFTWRQVQNLMYKGDQYNPLDFLYGGVVDNVTYGIRTKQIGPIADGVAEYITVTATVVETGYTLGAGSGLLINKLATSISERTLSYPQANNAIKALNNTQNILTDSQRNQVSEMIENPKLQNIFNSLYKRSDKFPGGTAGAIKYEQATGELLSPSGHLEKGVTTINALTKLLQNPSLSQSDKEITQILANQLINAIKGQ